MEKAKKLIEGLRLDLQIDGNDEIAREASKIVRNLPMYDIYYNDDEVIAKENFGFIGGKDDYSSNHIVVYDIASLDEERKNILKQALGENYKTTEIVVDQKKEIKPFFSRKKTTEETPGNTIEYYIPYKYVKENVLDADFLSQYAYEAYPCLLNGEYDNIRKTPSAYVKSSSLITEANTAYYRLIGNKLDEIEQIVDPNQIWELVKIGERLYAEPQAIKNKSK